MARVLVLYLWLVSSLSVAILVRENIIFNKISDISLSTLNWKLTMVVDMNAYENAFDAFLVHLKRIEVILTSTVDTHRKNNVNTFEGYYSDLRRELYSSHK